MAMVASPAMPDWLVFLVGQRAASGARLAWQTPAKRLAEPLPAIRGGGPGTSPPCPCPIPRTAERDDACMLGARGSTSHVRRRRCRRGRPQATADQGLTGPSRRQLASSCWRRQRNERERGSMLRTGRLPPPGSLCSALQRSPARGGSCARATGPQALLPPQSMNRFETTTRLRTFSTGIGPNWRLSREFH